VAAIAPLYARAPLSKVLPKLLSSVSRRDDRADRRLIRSERRSHRPANTIDSISGHGSFMRGREIDPVRAILISPSRTATTRREHLRRPEQSKQLVVHSPVQPPYLSFIREELSKEKTTISWDSITKIINVETIQRAAERSSRSMRQRYSVESQCNTECSGANLEAICLRIPIFSSRFSSLSIYVKILNQVLQDLLLSWKYLNSTIMLNVVQINYNCYFISNFLFNMMFKEYQVSFIFSNV